MTSVHSAAARIRKAAHPGKLHASVAEPGDLHIDLKGPFPPSLCGKFQYAVIAIDQHTRYVFIAFIRNKSEAPEAVKKIIAEFNAIVGTPTDEDGKPMARPTVRRLHRDHEGGLESRGDNLPRLVIEALDGSTAAEPAYPELVKPYQCGVGALMYLCVARGVCVFLP